MTSFHFLPLPKLRENANFGKRSLVSIIRSPCMTYDVKLKTLQSAFDVTSDFSSSYFDADFS